MQTPVEIDFQGMSARPDIHASIEQHLAALEQRYGRVTACRVVLKAPGEHHRTGGLYEVNIRLVLPNGREVDVGRTPQADERHADHLPSMTPSSMRGGSCRIMFAVCKDRSTDRDREEPRCFRRLRIP